MSSDQEHAEPPLGSGASAPLDESFDRLARRTGAEFRRTASSADIDAVIGRARRRQQHRAVSVVGAAVILVAAGVWWAARDRGAVPVVPPETTAVSTTTVPRTVGVRLAGEVTYQLTGNNGVRIHRLLPDGTDGGLALAGLPVTGSQEHLDYSPDGGRVVVTVTDDEGADDLWVAGIDGTDARLVVDCSAPCLAADEAAWSPDGTTIAFSRVVQPGSVFTSTLELLDVVSGETSVLLTADPSTVILAPRWSPDGTRLVVERARLAGPNADADVTGGVVGVVDVADPAAGIRPLTDLERFANNPDWSRTGDLIVFAARVPGTSTLQDLYVVAPDGTGERRLTNLADDGSMAVQPTFTPDGAAVLFTDKVRGGLTTRLYIVPVAGATTSSEAVALDVVGEFARMRPSG